MRKAVPIRCILVLAAPLLTVPAHAQLEGTLFTQPEERAYLDYLREDFLRNSQDAGFDIEQAIPVVPAAEATADPGPQEFTYGGIMMRRDGSRSIWLNGRLLAERELPSGISLVAGNPASLRIAHEGKSFVLRPGQTVMFATGNIIENYQRPRIAGVEPPPATNPAGSSDAETPSGTDAGILENSAAQNTSESIQGNFAAVANALLQLNDEQVATLVEAIESMRAQAEETAVEEDADDAGE